MTVCLTNALAKLKSPMCEERDYYAGKVNGIEEILKIEEKYKFTITPKEVE